VSKIATVILNFVADFYQKDFITTVENIKSVLNDNGVLHQINKAVLDVSKLDKDIIDDFQKIFNEYKFRYYEDEFKTFNYQHVKSLISYQVSRVQREFQILKNVLFYTKKHQYFFAFKK
jgi:enolase